MKIIIAIVTKAITTIALIIELRLGLLSLKYSRKISLTNNNCHKLYQTSIEADNIVRLIM